MKRGQVSKHSFGGVIPDINKSAEENTQTILDLNVLLAIIVHQAGGELRVENLNSYRAGPPLRLAGKYDYNSNAITLKIVDFPEFQ